MLKEKEKNLVFLDRKRFAFLEKIKEKFPQAEIFLVGGAVRDLFLKKKTKDYDFVVRKVKLKDLENFLAAEGRVNLVGQCFGVFKFIPKQGDEKTPFEIALPRKDFSLKTGGYRDVEIQTSPGLLIEKDLSRRDFTINAMAFKWLGFDEKEKGVWTIIDPFKGRKDLKKKLIRAVGKPEQRFKEDYSRILRAMRLACQLGFKIEKTTWQALKEQVVFLNKVKRDVITTQKGRTVESQVIEKRVIPYEVIAKEVLKAFLLFPLKAFDLYNQSGAFKKLMPEVLEMKGCPQPKNYHSEGDVWEHTRLALKKINSPSFKNYFKVETSIEVIMAVLFHDLGKPYTIQTPEKDKTDRIRFNEHDTVGAQKAKEIAQRLKFSSPDKIGLNIEEMVWLVKEHMILIRGDIAKMRPKTIEKYFFHPYFSGKKLLQVSFLDIAATITKKGPLSFEKFNQMVSRIEDLKKMSQNKENLPKRLLTGHDIIKEFRLSPGPKIGRLLELVREKQLEKKIRTKKQALDLLRNYLSK